MSFGLITILVYALILLAGAFMGLKAGSKISLIMGMTSSVIMFIAFYIGQSNGRLGFILAALMSGFLTFTFAQRYFMTHKIMPSGMLGLLSLVVLMICLIQIFHYRS